MKTLATVCVLGVTMALSSYAINRPASDDPITTPPKLPDGPAEKLPVAPPTPENKSQAQDNKSPSVWLGIVSEPVHPAIISQLQLSGNPGILVQSLGPQSPAKKAGLQEYDIILGINDSVIRKPEDISKAIISAKPGDKATIHLIRGGKNKDIEVTLEEAPAHLPRVDGIMADGAGPKALNQRGLNSTPGLGGRQNLRNLNQLFRNLPDDWSGDFEEMDRLFDEMLNNSFAPPALPQQLQQIPGAGTSSSFSSKFNLSSNGTSVSVQSVNGNTTIKATDSKGEVIYEGPYNTEEEKSNVPSAVQKIMKGISFSN